MGSFRVLNRTVIFPPKTSQIKNLILVSVYFSPLHLKATHSDSVSILNLICFLGMFTFWSLTVGEDLRYVLGLLTTNESRGQMTELT